MAEALIDLIQERQESDAKEEIERGERVEKQLDKLLNDEEL